MKDSLLDLGFITGSRAYGTNTDISDWDVVIPVYSWDRARKNHLIKGFPEEDSNYFAGKKYKTYNGVINLIPVHPHDFKAWYLATLAMTASYKAAFYKEPSFPSSAKKYCLFSTMRSLYGGIITEHKRLESYVVENSRIIEESKHSLSRCTQQFLSLFEEVDNPVIWIPGGAK